MVGLRSGSWPSRAETLDEGVLEMAVVDRWTIHDVFSHVTSMSSCETGVQGHIRRCVAKLLEIPAA